jgi:hypothetical protein
MQTGSIGYKRQRKTQYNRQIRHETSYKQLEVKTNQISFLYGKRYGHGTQNVNTYNMTTQKIYKDEQHGSHQQTGGELAKDSSSSFF